ncbi:MAG: phospholipid carrier-dependent glycosyltransferase, partial [Patescibacteria group bacterium]|nr:phospholipid carrier-dependent glycosyltransferase [Patescibacteria group bacterium]
MIRIFAHPNQPKGNEIEQYKFGEDFLYKSGNNAQQIVFVVRIQNIILTLLLAIIIFVWAKELWGFWGGLISLTLLIFCPNILAHGRLATTDIGSVFYFVL